MRKLFTAFACLLLLSLCFLNVHAADRADIIVAKDGSGNFTTIQAAINSINAANATYKTILIKNGIYNEHIFIDKSYIALVGESRQNTRIEFSLAREDWNLANKTNAGSGIIDIGVSSANGTTLAAATNIILGNMTIINTYPAANDKYTHVVRGEGVCNKIIALYCTFLCTGKDTYALWNKAGVYYQSNCSFKGGIDAVCPRGASYDIDCEYIETNNSAPVWQEGTVGANQKYVIRNGVFKALATNKFKLLNSQLEPHFYFMDCTISPYCTGQGSVTNGTAYYYNTHTETVDQPWHANNLTTTNQINVTPLFTYNNTWDPENTMPAVLPYAAVPQPWNKAYDVSKTVTLKWVGGRNAVSYNLYLGQTNQPSLIANTNSLQYATTNLAAGTYFWRVDVVTDTQIIQGNVWSFTVGNSNPPPPPQMYNLTTAVVGLGTISPASGSFAAGATIALTATPAGGWKFDAWTGAITGTNNPANVIMNANQSVTATFSQIPTTATTIIIQENQPGFCSFNGTIDNNYTGYTGAGFVNTPNALGNGISWSINIPSTGAYAFVWRYADGKTTNRTAQVMVDGAIVVAAVQFPITGSWTTWTNTAQTNINLVAGTHTIRLQATTANGLANIDCVNITGINPLATTCTALPITKINANIATENEYSFFSVSPNPVNDVVTIKLNKEFTQQYATVQLIDNKGAIVLKKRISDIAPILLNITTLQPGTYFINILYNGKNHMQRIVKQ